MTLTDEQYAEIGAAVVRAYKNLSFGRVEVGRAAVAAVAPLLLAEPDVHECSAVGLSTAFGYPATRKLFANRLASLTAKPDPAIEAVRKLFDMDGRGTVRILDRSPEEIVAAVDAARAK